MTQRVKSDGGKKTGREIRHPDVEAIFNAYPKKVRARLEALRHLIFDTARATAGVGMLEETLKWGQPSYRTTATNSGSTIRIDRLKSEPDKYAMYFHCQTDLVATFRAMYPRELTYGGNRSILFHANDEVDEKALRHCVALALTYHMRKSPSGLKAAIAPKSRR